MLETKIAPPTPRPRTRAPRLRAAILARLERIRGGRLELRDAHGVRRFGADEPGVALAAAVQVHDDSFWRDVAFRGVLGAGEAYAAGKWTADDPVAVVRLLLQNREILGALDGGLARLSRPLLAAFRWARDNTRRGSRRNIAAHYDLGNDFFALFLDETMTYSAGVFEHEGSSLAEASIAKYDRLARKLGLEPEHHVLEIGCGWGGFAVHTAARYGCRVTATTLSAEQARHARARVREQGLEDRVEIVERDYRDLEGRFDRIVSIEMIEAVGHRHLDTYVRTLSDRLTEDGLAAIQAITIADQHYDRARRTTDFIKRHVFPGSFIPSVAAITGSVARAGDLRLVHLEDIGLHYATTLERWRARFRERAADVRALGFPETFLRAWDYYLAYCEAGFRERFLSNVQLLLAKPRAGITAPRRSRRGSSPSG